ncbi:MAG TPA: PQQ-binding-like beta-propeller repeat protein, partial [Thermoanaerobaculia bacterium]
MSRHVDRELLPLLENRLDEEGCARVAAHLAACERCRARYGELRFSHGLVRELPTARLPDERADAVRAALLHRRRELRRPAARSPWPSFVVWRWLAPIGAAALLVLAVSLTPVLQASPGWPQWRGPARDGKSPETGLLREWPADGPPLAWRADGLGHGFASVSVAGGRIFTLGDLGDGQYVIALEQSTGRRLWATRIGPSWDDELLAPRATPTVDGRRVFAMSTEGVVASLDAATGDLRWRRSLPEEYGGRVMKTRGGQDWKWSESPLVDGERVIVTPGVRDAALVAL